MANNKSPINMSTHYTRENFLEGRVLLIDKPLEWTSFQAVNAIKWAIRKKYSLKKIKVGHAGTLDPLATGLLIVCTGKATKKISDLQALPKEYTGIICLGATTPSFDLETPIEQTYQFDHIAEKDIYKMASQFTGDIAQQPPVYSAIKKQGKRLYEFARKGESVEVPSRIIRIFEFEITAIIKAEIHFRVLCSKGTYIRSLANDFGKALGTGAYLSALKRTKIGEYHVNMARSPQEFKEKLLGENSNC